jgi:hypothetical protein
LDGLLFFLRRERWCAVIDFSTVRARVVGLKGISSKLDNAPAREE